MGDKPTVDYGVANVLVGRHKIVAGVDTGVVTSIWAQYATPLGSPVGNNVASGVFRFTCATRQAPCTISVTAAVLGSANHSIYPRLVVTRDGDGDGGGSPALVQCEYADGSTGAAPMTITHQASTPTPTYTAVPMNIGGSADCGIVPGPGWRRCGDHRAERVLRRALHLHVQLSYRRLVPEPAGYQHVGS